MFLKLKRGTLVRVIGDPHFGRKFINGVPLERRGEREQSQLDDFRSLMTELVCPSEDRKAETVIMMGDLFDTFRVDNEVLLDVYNIIMEAATRHLHVMYFMIRGNHDVSRDSNVVSSFNILERMCYHLDNVVFVTKPTWHFHKNDDSIVMFPYEEFKRAEDVVKAEPYLDTAAVFGHWDLVNFGDDHNIAPLDFLETVTDVVVTGHIHDKGEFLHGESLNVIKTGSMQPYAHGEDSAGTLYVTHTLDEFEQNIASDPGYYHNKVLRILLKPGEVLPVNVDCLQFSFKNVGQDNTPEAEVQMENFSFKTLFDQCMVENGVSAEDSEEVWNKYKEKNSDAQDS